MNAEESKHLLEQAKALMKQGDFARALPMLEQLYRAYPQDRTILYYSAACLENTGRYDDAVRVCDALFSLHGDERAREITARIQSARRVGVNRDLPVARQDLELGNPAALDIPTLDGMTAGGGQPGLDITLLDDLVGAAPRRAPLPMPPVGSGWDDDRRKWRFFTIALVVLMLGNGLFFGAMSMYAGKSWMNYVVSQNGKPIVPSNSEHDRKAMEDALASTMNSSITTVFVEYLVMLPTMFLLSIYLLYTALMILKCLPHDDFWDNLKDVALYSFLCGLVGLIPIVGWIVGIVILVKHYQLGCGSFLLLVLLEFIIGMCFLSLWMGGHLAILFIMGTVTFVP